MMSKQVVGKPPKVKWVYPYPIYSCPRCGGYVATAKLYRASYCSDCGQKINWSGFSAIQEGDFYDWRVADSCRHNDEVQVAKSKVR